MEQVRIKYVGHACFKLTYQKTDILIDPFRDGLAEEFSPMREDAHYVFCSHDHTDHNFMEAVALHPTAAEPPFTVDQIEVPHDECGGSKRGMNTIRIFTFGEIKVAHMGDIGRILTDEEVEKLSGLDCMMIPVGGFYTIDAAQAKTIVEQTRPRIVIPMHYRSSDKGLPAIGTLDQFTEGLADVNYCGSETTLSKEMPEQILVLKPVTVIEE